MALRSVPLAESLRKAKDYDKDVRIIALSDIYDELERGASIDPSTTRRVCDTILERLEKDTSSDVQAGAVKCLSTVVKRTQVDQVQDVCRQLARHLQDPAKRELHDIYSIGLKTCILEATPEVGAGIVDTLTSSVRDGCKSADSHQRAYWLEILKELVARYGGNINADALATFVVVVRTCLEDTDRAVRKRAAIAAGAVGAHAEDEPLAQLVYYLLDRIGSISLKAAINDAKALGYLRANVQALASIARNVGYRLGDFTDRSLPLLTGMLGSAEDEDLQADTADELREHCLHAVEALVLHCPFHPQALSTLEVCCNFVSYDPNYADDDEDAEAGSVDSDEDGFDEEDEDEEFELDEEDDDTSWKVRRAAARVVRSIISTAAEASGAAAEVAIPALAKRFTEREESVLTEVTLCVQELYELGFAAGTCASSTVPPPIKRHLSSLYETETSAHATAQTESAGHKVDVSALATEVPVSERERLGRTLLSSATMVANSALSAIRKGQRKTAVQATERFLHVIQCVVRVAASQLIPLQEQIEQTVLQSLQGSHSNTQLAAMQVFCTTVDYFDPAAFLGSLSSLADAIRPLTRGDWYKISAQAFRSLGRLAVVVGTNPSTVARQVLDDLVAPVAEVIPASDADQEVREAALVAYGVMASQFYEHHRDALAALVPSLLQKVNKDVMRLSALRALTMACDEPASARLDTIQASSGSGDCLDTALTVLGPLLRQQSWQLRRQSILLLNILLLNHRDVATVAQVKPALEEATDLLHDADLNTAAQVLEVGITLARSQKSDLMEAACSQMLPKAIPLAASPVMQQQVTVVLARYFAAVCSSGSCIVREVCDQLVHQLESGEVSSSQMRTVSRCLSAILQDVDMATARDMLQQLISVVSDDKASVARRAVAVMTTGEMAATSPDKLSPDEVTNKLFDALKDSREAVQSAAADGLGAVCSAHPTLLPRLLDVLRSDEEGDATSKFLVLVAIKEMLSRALDAGGSALTRVQEPAKTVLSLMRDSVRNTDEGHQRAISEVLARLIIVAPITTLNRLHEQWLHADAVELQRTALMAVQAAAADGRVQQELTTSDVMDRFLPMLRSARLQVRQAALSMTASLIHYVPSSVDKWLISPESEQDYQDLRDRKFEDLGVLRVIYNESQPKPELVREVNMGPFTHKVDEGLPVRKAAAHAVVEAAKQFPQKFDDTGISIVLSLVKDNDEIRITGLHSLTALAASRSAQPVLASNLSRIIAAMNQLMKKLVDRTDAADVGRAAVRLVLALDACRFPAGARRPLSTLMSDLGRVQPFADMLAQIRSEQRM